MAANIVTTTWIQNTLFKSDNPSGNHVFTDTLNDNNKTNKSLTPKAMMLSSLAGCSGLDVTSVLKKMKSTIDAFKMEITGELSEEHPVIYHTVTVDYHFYGTALDEDKINKAVKLSVDKYCGVMEMFRKFAEVKTNNHFHHQ